MKTFNNISAKAEITDLENLGWDFDHIYNEVAEAQGISFEAAQKFERENYCVRITVDEQGNTYYTMCQQAHFGNQEFGKETTGDDRKTLDDLEFLFNQKKLWDFTEY